MIALMWKKYKCITHNLKNIVYFFIIPIALLLILTTSNNNNAVLCYFPFISITFGILFEQMDIENIVQKEYAMYTPMSLKESWIFSSVTLWLFRFIYSVLTLILGMLVYRFLNGVWYAPLEFLVQGVINGVSALGIVFFATQYEMDFSRLKQWLSFVWVPSALICALMLDNKASEFIPTGFKYCVYLLILSTTLLFFSLWQSKKVTTENFINSLGEVRKIVTAKFNIIDD